MGLLATMLVACAPSGGQAGGAGTPGASQSGTPSPRPDAASLDGVWVVRLDDPASGCILLQDRLLHVSGGVATISPHVAGLEDGDPQLSGPATLDGDAADIHVTNAAPTKDSIDFTGTRRADGTIAGTAKPESTGPLC